MKHTLPGGVISAAMFYNAICGAQGSVQAEAQPVIEPATGAAPTAPKSDAAPVAPAAPMEPTERVPPVAPKFLDGAGLLKFGLTLGLGVAIQIPFERSDKLKQVSLAASPMPYVLVTPGTWALGDVSREYCASRGLTLDTDVASKQADEYAEKLAINQNPAVQTMSQPTKNKAIETETGWVPKQKGRCWWSAIGFYAGFPFSYDANFETIGAYSPTKAKLSARPLISFGVAWVPIPYFSVLAGITPLNVEIPATAESGSEPATRSRVASSWAWTLALGGNLDFVKPLFKL